ncbi:MAG: hypothetical protein ACI4UW_07785, partial [Muribaculaceae bacterium]
CGYVLVFINFSVLLMVHSGLNVNCNATPVTGATYTQGAPVASFAFTFKPFLPILLTLFEALTKF